MVYPADLFHLTFIFIICALYREEIAMGIKILRSRKKESVAEVEVDLQTDDVNVE